MKRILFRADGNTQIGLGHVMRCLALADMLRNTFSMCFAITEPAADLNSKINDAGLSILLLPASEADNSFLDAIDADDIVVLDGYLFNESFQQAIRSRAHKLIFIDDLAAGHQVADIIINHAGGIAELEYDTEPYTRLYLGPQYALLRPDFLRPEGFGDMATDGPIFVSLGGADPQNTSLTVLRGIQQANNQQAVRLVLGPLHPDRASIDRFKTQLPNLTILQNLGAADMSWELQNCRLAITSCSTVSYEVCAVNRPLIGIVTADNQDRLAQFLADERLAVSVNFPHLLSHLKLPIGLDTAVKLAIQSADFSPETVAETLAHQRRFFDGHSPERFRSLFSQL
jgi:UDP-2,4-diacetamido-2,4,6-trideoxy-beta-L-altropyranose hydrolase